VCVVVKRIRSNFFSSRIDSLDVSRERGATMVEFAIVFPFLLIFLLTTIDFVMLLHEALSIEYVLAKASRDIASTGTQSSSLGTHSDRVTAIKSELKFKANVFGVDLEDTDISVCPAWEYDVTQWPACLTEGAGKPHEVLVIAVKKRIALFFRQWSFTVDSSVIVRNEPFGNI